MVGNNYIYCLEMCEKCRHTMKGVDGFLSKLKEALVVLSDILKPFCLLLVRCLICPVIYIQK